MSVSEYNAKFTELSRYVSQVIDTEKENAQKFQEGLVYYVNSRITPLKITGYEEAYERALVIEDTSGRPALERQAQQRQ